MFCSHDRNRQTFETPHIAALFYSESHRPGSSHRGVRYFLEPSYLTQFRTGIGNFAHIGVSAPLCDKNLRMKTFKKTTAQCAKTPMITVLITKLNYTTLHNKLP